ncbi:hypothetical protein EG329_012134 [Mollisiaceae sp. DMI_Dod_QoI]|nr:hypothetical protein EG329_012134 [Helotiales sp. DMI_Dod_QoI]
MRGRNEMDLDNAIEFAEGSVERTKNIDVDGRMELLMERQSNVSLCYFTKAYEVDDSAPEVFEDAVNLAK